MPLARATKNTGPGGRSTARPMRYRLPHGRVRRSIAPPGQSRAPSWLQTVTVEPARGVQTIRVPVCSMNPLPAQWLTGAERSARALL